MSVLDHAREEFSLESSPPALSHFTDAVRWWNVLFISGCVALNVTGEVVAPGDAATQARAVHRHWGSALPAAGTDFAHVLKVTVYLTDINDPQGRQ